MQIYPHHSNVLRPGASSLAPASRDGIKLNTGNRVEGVTRVEQTEAFQALSQADKSQEGTAEYGASESPLAVDVQSPTPEQLASRLGAKLQYEQQTQAAEGAVAQYLTHQHASEREAIQQMVGIDTYA